MYYPSSAGGGSQRLFRKVGSQSSKYFSESSVRQTGSYIYEEFLPTDGTDVKVCDFCDSILSRKISSCTKQIICTYVQYTYTRIKIYVCTSKYIIKLKSLVSYLLISMKLCYVQTCKYHRFLSLLTEKSLLVFTCLYVLNHFTSNLDDLRIKNNTVWCWRFWVGCLQHNIPGSLRKSCLNSSQFQESFDYHWISQNLRFSQGLHIGFQFYYCETSWGPRFELTATAENYWSLLSLQKYILSK